MSSRIVPTSAPRGAAPGEVHEFVASMPAAYARAFTVQQAAEHSGIVARRGVQLAHAEVGGGHASRPFVCVVADDRPGLLSLVSDALLVHGLNVTNAQIYCRRRSDGRQEAVDFFWLEPAHTESEEGVELSELTSFAQTLRELIAEDQVVSQQSPLRDTIPAPRPKPSRVYFELDALCRKEYVLIVETLDFPGLLFAISSALHGQGVRIAASDIRTKDGVARDWFVLESIQAQPFTAERLCDVQQAVLAAVMAGGSSR